MGARRLLLECGQAQYSVDTAEPLFFLFPSQLILGWPWYGVQHGKMNLCSLVSFLFQGFPFCLLLVGGFGCLAPCPMRLPWGIPN